MCHPPTRCYYHPVRDVIAPVHLCSQTWFHLASKDPGEYIDHKFRAAPIGLFHHINTYEDEGFVVVDVCAWKG